MLRCHLIVYHGLLVRIRLPVRRSVVIDKVPSPLLTRRKVAGDAGHVPELKIAFSHHSRLFEHEIRLLSALLLLGSHLWRKTMHASHLVLIRTGTLLFQCLI